MNCQQLSNVVTRADLMWRHYLETRTSFRRLARQTCESENVAVAHRLMREALERFAVLVATLMDVGYYLVVHRERIVSLREVPLSRAGEIVAFSTVVSLVESFAASLSEGLVLPNDYTLCIETPNGKEAPKTGVD